MMFQETSIERRRALIRQAEFWPSFLQSGTTFCLLIGAVAAVIAIFMEAI